MQGLEFSMWDILSSLFFNEKMKILFHERSCTLKLLYLSFQQYIANYYNFNLDLDDLYMFDTIIEFEGENKPLISM